MHKTPLIKKTKTKETLSLVAIKNKPRLNLSFKKTQCERTLQEPNSDCAI